MIEEIEVPESVEGPGWSDFVAYVRVRNDVEAHALGSDVLRQEPVELIPPFRSNPQRARRTLVARVDGEVVGRAMVTTRPHAVGAGAHVIVDVLPSHRRRGIGAALLERAEAVGRASGSPMLQSTTIHTALPGAERVAASTGFGDVSVDDPGVRFLLNHGYALEQVARVSDLDLRGAGPGLAELRAAAGAAGRDFHLRVWQGPTPHEWLDDLAHLRTRMSIDPPAGGIKIAPDVWDATRISEHDRREVTTGRSLFTAAAEHVSSGRLAGFTEVAVAPHAGVGMQGATLVLREHRGHRLGLLLKVAVTESVMAHAPGAECIVTFNAEENQAMLDVNEQLGFRPIGLEAAWQKHA